MPVRLLLVLVILAILSGCEQTSLLPEEAEKQVGVERAESVPQVAPQPAPEPVIEEPPLDSTDELVGDFCHPENVPDYRLASAKGAGNDLMPVLELVAYTRATSEVTSRSSLATSRQLTRLTMPCWSRL